MMKWLWGGMLAAGLIYGMAAGNAEGIMDSLTSGAQQAVTLALELAGAYMLWMGLMKLAEHAGLIKKLSRLMQPLMRRLFPSAPEAIAPITLNMAANFLGLGSAATPFGLAAMQKLQEKNETPQLATHDMCLFLALNSAALELLPAGVLALRSAAGSQDAYCVVLPTFIASVAAFVVALGLSLLLRGK